MSWLKVDDQFGEHWKVAQLGQHRVAAVGLWTLCGVWASAHAGNAGCVTHEVVSRYDPDHFLAKKLVEVGLWHVTEHPQWGPAYAFHDWEVYRSPQARDDKKKSDTRRRVQALRQRRKVELGVDDFTYNEDGPCVTGNAAPALQGNAGSNADVRVTTDPDPTRPGSVTTHPESEALVDQGGVGGDAPRKRSARTDGTRLPEDWRLSDQLKKWVVTECTNLDREAMNRETASFVDYWQAKAGKDAKKLDWDATYRNWMRRADGNAASRPSGRGVRSAASTGAQRAAAVRRYRRPEPTHEPTPLVIESTRITSDGDPDGAELERDG